MIDKCYPMTTYCNPSYVCPNLSNTADAVAGCHGNDATWHATFWIRPTISRNWQ